MQTRPDNIIEIFLARYIRTLANIWTESESSFVPKNIVLNDYYDSRELQSLLESYNSTHSLETPFDSLTERTAGIIYPTVVRRLKRALDSDKKKFGITTNNTGAMMLADTVCREIYPNFLETEVFLGEITKGDPEEYEFFARELRACPPLLSTTSYTYIGSLFMDVDKPLNMGAYIRLMAKRLYPGAEGALLSLPNRAAAIVLPIFKMIDYAELNWPKDIAEKFIRDTSAAISDTLERILEMESPENESPSLTQFLYQTGFLAEVPSGTSPELEAKVRARLSYCIRELQEITGLDLSNCRSSGEAAVVALKKGKFLEESSATIAAAVEDCIALLEIGDSQD